MCGTTLFLSCLHVRHICENDLFMHIVWLYPRSYYHPAFATPLPRLRGGCCRSMKRHRASFSNVLILDAVLYIWNLEITLCWIDLNAFPLFLTFDISKPSFSTWSVEVSETLLTALDWRRLPTALFWNHIIKKYSTKFSCTYHLYLLLRCITLVTAVDYLSFFRCCTSHSLHP